MIVEIFSILHERPEVPLKTEVSAKILMKEYMGEQDYEKKHEVETELEIISHKREKVAREKKERELKKKIRKKKNRLTKTKGVNYFRGHRETYYNLPMHNIIRIMQRYGDYKYWIREDGVKMLNEYVMVAANFDIYPRGSIVETSLGTGIVVDTGSFVKDYPYGYDIAVSW